MAAAAAQEARAKIADYERFIDRLQVRAPLTRHQRARRRSHGWKHSTVAAACARAWR
jgi:hypothetical protein